MEEEKEEELTLREALVRSYTVYYVINIYGIPWDPTGIVQFQFSMSKPVAQKNRFPLLGNSRKDSKRSKQLL